MVPCPFAGESTYTADFPAHAIAMDMRVTPTRPKNRGPKSKFEGTTTYQDEFIEKKAFPLQNQQIEISKTPAVRAKKDNRTFQTMSAEMNDPRKWTTKPVKPRYQKKTKRKLPPPRFQGMSEYEAEYIERHAPSFPVQSPIRAVQSARGPNRFEGQSSYATDFKVWDLEPPKVQTRIEGKRSHNRETRDWRTQYTAEFTKKEKYPDMAPQLVPERQGTARDNRAFVTSNQGDYKPWPVQWPRASSCRPPRAEWQKSKSLFQGTTTYNEEFVKKQVRRLSVCFRDLACVCACS